MHTRHYGATVHSDHSPGDDSIRALGALVLDNGLAPAPTSRVHSEMYALAFWKSGRHGAVVFLDCRARVAEQGSVGIWGAPFRLVGDNWQRGLTFGGELRGEGATIEAKIASQLNGQAIVITARTENTVPKDDAPNLTLSGWHSAEVEHLMLVQSNDAVRFGAHGHLGAWVLGIVSTEPWQIEARDRGGRLISTVDKKSFSLGWL
jgi:hypothetical protein